MRFLLFCFIFLSGCAVRKTPQGGPIDTEAPKVLQINPKDSSTLFRGSSIRFQFDEFIQLKGIENALLVNPALEHPVRFKNYGKQVELLITDTLLEDMTYTFTLSKGIADINEGKEISELSYTLSTGAVVDQGQLSGQVRSADGSSATEGLLVGLYPKGDDTSAYVQKPFYKTYTQVGGFFKFRHLKKASYRILVFKDLNKNLVLDRYFEATSLPKVVTVNDSSSLVDLLLFEEAFPYQKLKSYTYTEPVLQLKYTQPIDHFKLEELPDTSQLYYQWNSNDSVSIWLPKNSKTRTFISSTSTTKDTLKISPKKDGFRLNNDTLLTISPQIGLTYNRTPYFSLKVNQPLSYYNPEGLQFIGLKDTQNVISSSKKGNLLEVLTDLNSNGTLLILPNTLKSIYGATHTDTLEFKVSNFNPIDSGILHLKVLLDSSIYGIQHLLQIKTKQNEIVVETDFKDSLDLNYSLPIGSYEFILIKDDNNDCQRTMGSFYPYQEPEQQLIHPQGLTLKKRWKTEFIWDFKHDLKRH